MRFRLVVLVTLALATTGCLRPSPGPASAGPQGGCKTYYATAPPVVADAIYRAFGHLGQEVVNQAGRVACCESGWGPEATNGQYRGLFQLGYNYNGTITFYGGNVFNAFTNAQVARDSYVTRGYSWSAFQCQP